MADNEQSDAGSSMKGMYRLGMLLGVIGIASLAGYASSHFLGGSGEQQVSQDEDADLLEDLYKSDSASTDYMYYKFEPIVANLDDPRQNRHLKLTVVLAIKPKVYQIVSEIVKKRDFELRDWIDTYLAGCTLDEVRGRTNRNRIKRTIWETLNDKLWPGKKHLIDHVLFGEFKVQ